MVLFCNDYQNSDYGVSGDLQQPGFTFWIVSVAYSPPQTDNQENITLKGGHWPCWISLLQLGFSYFQTRKHTHTHTQHLSILPMLELGINYVVLLYE